MRKNKNISEVATLLQKYKESKEVIYIGEIYSRYIHLVYGVCLAEINSRQKAQIAVMNIYDKLIAKESLPEEKDFKLWLYVVTLNYCRALKGELTEKDKQFEIIDDLMWKAEVEYHYNLTTFNTESYTFALNKILKSNENELTNTQKSYLHYFYKQKKSYSEIATIENTTTEKVMQLLKTTRKQINSLIQKHGNQE